MATVRTFLEFIRASAGAMLRGSRGYYGWLAFLLAWIALGAAAYAQQLDRGLVASNMTDQVCWGAYIANFTFLVGAAAAAVMLVIPTYLYRDSALAEVVILGEILAMVAIVMCLMFVTVDLGRPDRFWHLMPIVGRFNWPISLLSWDVIVLWGYLALNVWVATYLLFKRFSGRKPNRHLYRPFVYIAIGWAISIHTVTAFLYSGLAARPHWNAAVLAPRFLASAFAAGPALVMVALALVERHMGFPVKDQAFVRLRQIAAVAMIINLFLFASEVFTELYAGTSHSLSMRYHLFGLPGHRMLVPYTWLGVALDLFAVLAFTLPALHRRRWVLLAASAGAVVGVWIEKGMGLVVPGFVPSPTGEVVEYRPSFTEFFVSAGIWAFGALLYTLLLKVAVPIELGSLRARGALVSLLLLAACNTEVPPLVELPHQRAEAIPSGPLAGRIDGMPFELGDARLRVVSLPGRERTDVLLSASRPEGPCAPPAADAPMVWLRFPGELAPARGERRRTPDDDGWSVHYQRRAGERWIGEGRAAALLELEPGEHGALAGALTACFDDAAASCVAGTFVAIRCRDELDPSVRDLAP